MKVTLFATCLVDMFQGNVGKATVELLEHLGCEIDLPETQICCGQPSYNSGYVEDTKKVMKQTIDALSMRNMLSHLRILCLYDKTISTDFCGRSGMGAKSKESGR